MIDTSDTTDETDKAGNTSTFSSVTEAPLAKDQQVRTSMASEPPMPDKQPAYGHLRNWLSKRRWPGRDGVSGSGFESQRYLAKWLVLGSVIGVVAGLGAVLFYLAIQWATDFFLGTLVGYMPPSPVGEGSATLTAIARPWLLPLITGAGALIAGIIVFNLAPEAEGHGTDAAIDAIHHKGGRFAPVFRLIKLIASAITIGSGGSGGREGPAAQISAGFGSLLAQWLHLERPDRRIAVAAGMGAGIGAIFRAPLGGAVMAAEILYIHDLEVEALIPRLIASIVGYSVYGAFFGYTPIFGSQTQLVFDQPGATPLLRGPGGLLWPGRHPLCSLLLWHHGYLPPAEAAQMVQAGHRGRAGRRDGHRAAGGAAHGLRLGATWHDEIRPAGHPSVGGVAAPFRQDPRHFPLHWLGRVGRYLWPRHGDRRHAGRVLLAAGREFPAPDAFRACHRS